MSKENSFNSLSVTPPLPDFLFARFTSLSAHTSVEDYLSVTFPLLLSLIKSQCCEDDSFSFWQKQTRPLMSHIDKSNVFSGRGFQIQTYQTLIENFDGLLHRQYQ